MFEEGIDQLATLTKDVKFEVEEKNYSFDSI